MINKLSSLYKHNFHIIIVLLFSYISSFNTLLYHRIEVYSCINLTCNIVHNYEVITFQFWGHSECEQTLVNEWKINQIFSEWMKDQSDICKHKWLHMNILLNERIDGQFWEKMVLNLWGSTTPFNACSVQEVNKII